jgi:hypothetical protein
MPPALGRSFSLPLARRIVGDFLHASRHGAFVTFEREMALAAVRRARDAHPVRPPWPMLFLKALGIVAETCPELRQAFLRWPTSRIYEHPVPVGSVIVAKQLNGVEHLFALPLANPGQASLIDLAEYVRQARERPPAETRNFRRTIRYCNLPWPLRRFMWSWLDWSGKLRAEFLGTFGISATAGAGAAALNLVTPWAAGLCYAPFRPDGTLPVRLTFDHRVLDGAAACRILAETEAALTCPILEELTADGTTTG